MPKKENEISTRTGREPDSLAGNWKSYGAVKVLKNSTGARMSWSEDRSQLNINISLFPDENQADLAALRNVAGYIGLRQAILANVDVVLDLARNYPRASEHIFRWQGLARLRERDAEALKTSFTVPPSQSMTQEFYWAIDAYVATGHYPDQLSGPVRQAVNEIPRAEGLSLIDYFTSGRYLKFDGKNYTEFIDPITDRLSRSGPRTVQSEKYEYKSSPFSSSKEIINESDILVRVSPFYKGLYREHICRFNPDSHQIVKEAGIKQLWNTGEIPEDEAIWESRRKYDGIIKHGGETIIILPYDALPLDSTLKSARGLRFYRDDTGTVYLDSGSGSTTTAGSKFSFDFVIAETENNRLNIPPVDADFTPTGWELDQETHKFIEDLSSQSGLSDIEKAKQVASWVRGKVRYPKDKTEMDRINFIYLNSYDKLWMKIPETGIADCIWANIFKDELCKRLGIASRIAEGTNVRSQDPRFDFAIVDARGLIKHAWGEVWDKEIGEWIHEDMDATPGISNDDPADVYDDKGDAAGDDDKDSREDNKGISPDDIEKIKNELTGSGKSLNTGQKSNEKQNTSQSKLDIGQSWKRLEDWLTIVNKTIIPAAYSIRGKPSTLNQEWDYLLEDLYNRREYPVQKYTGPVRESEGDFLDDETTAVIDILSKDPDPMGHVFLDEKTEEQVTASAFDDDFILDISGSMRGKPAYEQRRMVLSSVYNMKNLNEKLNHSSRRNNMHSPLRVRSRVAVCGNWTRTVQESTKPINEESLVNLDNSLQDYTQASTGLAESLKQYIESLDREILRKIKKGTYTKVLTIVSDGEVTNKRVCIERITELRAKGIIVQGIGFGKHATDIKKICHDPNNPDAAVVIEDLTQAPIVRHRMLMKHLSKL